MHTVCSSQLTSGLVLAEAVKNNDEVLVEKFKILDYKDIKIIQKYTSSCKIYSLKELEPRVLKSNSFSWQYVNFLVKNFNLLFSSVFDNKQEFEELSVCISRELQKNREVLFSMIRLRQNHLYTYQHSTNVALLCLESGIVLELSDKELNDLVIGAILHDLGKLYIDNKILDKPDKLTTDEFTLIKRHPSISAEMIKHLDGISPTVTSIVLEHHEKLDGSGYPNKLNGNQINPLSKIVTACDIFDAVTSKRSYHEASTFEKGASILTSDVKSGKLDSYVVQSLLSKTVLYPIDTYVRLSNGVSGFVVVEDYNSNRPIIYDCINRKFYNLKEMHSVKIIYAV